MFGEGPAKTKCKDRHMLDLDVIVACDSPESCDWTRGPDSTGQLAADSQIMVGRDRTILSDNQTSSLIVDN